MFQLSDRMTIVADDRDGDGDKEGESTLQNKI